jgi:hypothetical protein
MILQPHTHRNFHSVLSPPHKNDLLANRFQIHKLLSLQLLTHEESCFVHSVIMKWEKVEGNTKALLVHKNCEKGKAHSAKGIDSEQVA